MGQKKKYKELANQRKKWYNKSVQENSIVDSLNETIKNEKHQT